MLRKVVRILPIVSYLILVKGALAAVSISAPNLGISPNTKVSVVLSNALTIIYVVAALLVLFYLVYGAFRWITSAGDKDAVAGARKTIVNALIGLAILALATLIVSVVGAILHINVLQPGGFVIPSLQEGDSGLQ